MFLNLIILYPPIAAEYNHSYLRLEKNKECSVNHNIEAFMIDLFKLLGMQLGLLKEGKYPSRVVEGQTAEPLIPDTEQSNHIYKDVLYNLDSKKVFLDSSLSLIKFSSIIGTNTTYLSNTINRYFGCNFKTLLNTYRIEYCKKVLSAKELNVPIKEIAPTCGFSSISAFYASFKKVTGISPVQYRMMMLYNRNERREQTF